MKASTRLFNPIHRNLIFPFFARKEGIYPLIHLRSLEKSQFFEPEQIDELRWRRAKALIDHAYRQCPFYQQRWDEAGIHPSRIQDWDDFRKIPFITKRDIQIHREKMRRRDVPVSSLVRNMTGGSTGEPLVFYMDRERVKSRFAAAIRHNRWAGIDISTLIASIWGHPGDIISPMATLKEKLYERYVSRAIFLDTSKLTLDLMRAFIDTLHKVQPEVYVAYSNSIYLLAQFIEKEGITDPHSPRAIVTSAEFLENSQRETIERVFRAPVFDRYGCRETSVLASECEAHEGMHVNAECIFMEVLKNNVPVKAGELGEVVITDLLNNGMPLIRYRIRDIATPVEGRCSCGRGLPRIRMVGGRLTAFLTTPEGRIVSGAALAIFLVANAPGVARAQLVQESKEEIRIRIVRGEQYSSESERYILAQGRKTLGEVVNLRIEYVDDIPLAPSGKNMFSISNVDPFS